MAIKKTIYKSKQRIVIGGSASVVIFLATIMGLAAYDIHVVDRTTGMPLSAGDSVKCAGNPQERCLKPIMFCTGNWSFGISSTFQLYTDDENATAILWNENMTKSIGKTGIKGIKSQALNVPAQSCVNATIEIIKAIDKDVKYTVGNVDPTFKGYGKNDFYKTMISTKTEIDRSEDIYEFKAATSFDIEPEMSTKYVYVGNSPKVSSKTIEFNTTIRVNITTYTNVTYIDKITDNSTGKIREHVKKSVLEPSGTKEISAESWGPPRTIRAGETIKVRETFTYPAGFRIEFDQQPILKVSGVKFVKDDWVFHNLSYQKGTNLTANESTGRAWTNIVYQWDMVNLSGAMTNMTDVIFVNESCDNGGSQIRGSINGTGDGYSESPAGGTDYFNFSIPLNMTASQNRIICVYYQNNTGVAPPARLQTQHSNFNNSASFNRSWVTECFDTSTALISDGTLNVTARSVLDTWFSTTDNHCRVFVPTINFSRGFTSNCEVSRREHAVSSGHFGGCGFWYHGPDAGFDVSSNMGGITGFDDNGGNTGALLETERRAVFQDTLWGAIILGIFNNESSKYETPGAGAKFSVILNESQANEKRAAGTMNAGYSYNKAAILNVVRAAADMNDMEVKWFCAMDINETCFANDMEMPYGIGGTVTQTIAQVNPNVTILAPTNTTYQVNNQSLNVMTNETYDKFWYILDSGTNVTFVPNTTIQPADGFHNITVYVNGTTGKIQSSQVNFTISTFNLSVFLPANTTYNSQNRSLEVTSNKMGQVDRVWYILNSGTNVTFTPNTTFLAVEGTNNLTVYANKTSPYNQTSFQVNFTLKRHVVNLTLFLDTLAQNRTYEYGSTIIINATANITGTNITIDIDLPNYGTNVFSRLTFAEINISAHTLANKFVYDNESNVNVTLGSNSSSYTNWSYSKSLARTEDTVHFYRFNISGMVFNGTYPKDIAIDVNNDSVAEFVVFGTLIGNELQSLEFSSGNASERINITVGIPITRQIRVFFNSSIVNASIRINAVVVPTINQTDGRTSAGGQILGDVGQNFTVLETIETDGFEIYATNRFGNGARNYTCGIYNVSNNVIIGNSTIRFDQIQNEVPIWKRCTFSVRVNLTANHNMVLYVNQTASGLTLPIAYWGFDCQSSGCINATGGYGFGKMYNNSQSSPNGTIPFASAYSDTADMMFRVFAFSQPRNLTIDTLADGTIDYNITGGIDTTAFSVPLNNTAIQSYIQKTANCTAINYTCLVPFRFSLGTGGQLNITQINITQVNFTPLIMNTSRIQAYLRNGSGFKNVSIGFASKTAGSINVSALNFNFTGRTLHVNITARFAGNDTHAPTTSERFAKIVASVFNITLPYTFTKDVIFTPSTNSSKNVTPFGQTNNTPIYNVSIKAYDEAVEVFIRFNQTIPSINITAANNSNYTTGFRINTLNQSILNNTNFNKTYAIFLWGDFNDSVPGAGTVLGRIVRNRTIVTKCTTCVKFPNTGDGVIP